MKRPHLIETKEQYELMVSLYQEHPILLGEDLHAITELIEALREVVRLVIVECERPENRGRMTQRQQADFLDSMRVAIKEALPDWITELEHEQATQTA